MKQTGTFLLKRNDIKLGLILGLITPLIILILIYFIKFDNYEFGEFLSVLIKENRLITFTGSWCLVANIALFTFYINTDRFNTAKGIFAVTLIYGILILLLKTLN